MANSSNTSSPSLSSTEETPPSNPPSIPASLKFLMSHLKSVVAQPLNADNHPLWRSHVLKLFKANGYQGFLDGTSPPPSQTTTVDGTTTPNPHYDAWLLQDQNLTAAMYSIISPTILPCVLSAEHCAEIWAILDRRLQSSTRSRIIQLWHELHYLTMKDKTMSQYLLDIKAKVDALAAAGATIPIEEVIHYTLDGLPQTYQAFKTAIRTNRQPLDLDELYTLLCSEELNLAHEATRELQSLQLAGNTTALAATRGRGRGQSSNRGRNSSNTRSNPSNNRDSRTARSAITCQICDKTSHSAVKCWHRHDDNYNSDQPTAALFTSPATNSSTEWFLDSGASSHLTSNPNNLHTSQPYTGNTQVTLGNGHQIPIQNIGNGLLPTPQGSLRLTHLNLVPNLSFNLISVYKLTHDNDCLITFSSHGYELKDRKTRRTLLKGPSINGLYPIRAPHQSANDTSQLALVSIQSVPDLWHRRLGHPSSATLSHLANQDPNICISSFKFLCNSCKMAKSHRLPFNKSQSISSAPFYIIHSDVWGPSPFISNNGYKYYVSFIDDHSKFTWVYPLRQKSEVFAKFLEFQHMLSRQFQAHIKIFRTDGGGEYINKHFQTHLTNQGIIHQFTCPYSPPQNGVAERKHRHITETVRTLIFTASIPNHLWVDTLLTAVYLINRLPSPNTHNKSPYTILYKANPNFSHLKVFGCLCYPWLKPYAAHKLSPLSQPCVFIGYAPNQKGYRCLDIKTNKIYVSPRVVFNETIFPFSQSTDTTITTSPQNLHLPPLLLVPSTSLPFSTHPQTHMPSHHLDRHHTVPTTASSIPQTTQRSSSPASQHSTSINAQTNTNQPAQPVTHPMLTRSKTGHNKPKTIFNLSHIIHTEPTTYNQAVKSEHWRAAMSQEFQALQMQGTWDLVPPNSNQNIVGCKWTYITKLNSDGSIARYKARLVAKGFHQEHGLDYTETFSPVAKIPTIRVLILLALHYNCPIHQLDVSNAFLHGKLSDTVYMQQPQGFQNALHPTYVCKLNKALYGLKQSPREWYATLSTHLQAFEFLISSADPSLLTYKSKSTRLYILIYVDDILLTGNSPTEIDRLLTSLHKQFQMRNLGSLAHFLGIQTVHTKYGILLHQQQYAHRILAKAGMQNAKPVANPSSGKSSINSNPTNKFANPHLYCQLIGSL
ncbi:hypothetical protein KFK09_018448 [Dendrobium nobile]|uniref:Integrase catalytic domain-containing protein n=1 Tax=Dendrobium nobile TaxID=94219 RepID=A0A8T3AV91_DENNO|nr:hypothetical protein KFK09_018448 [Dendrobium nobile]